MKLDPDGELLPIQRYAELRSAAARRSHWLAKQTEQRITDSNQMNAGPDVSQEEAADDSPLAIQAGADGPSLRAHVEQNVDLARLVRKHYCEDPVFAKILAHPDAHQQFGVRDRLIWTKNQMGCDIICLPRKAFLRGRRLVEVIIDQAHTTIGHFGRSSTARYI